MEWYCDNLSFYILFCSYLQDVTGPDQDKHNWPETILVLVQVSYLRLIYKTVNFFKNLVIE